MAHFGYGISRNIIIISKKDQFYVPNLQLYPLNPMTCAILGLPDLQAND